MTPDEWLNDYLDGKVTLYPDELMNEESYAYFMSMCHKSCEEPKMINLMGLIYKYRHDFDNAIKYYQMAIEKGNDKAMRNLGYLYHYEPEKKNLDEAIKYYQMAIEKGNSNAMNSLGSIYHTEPEKKNLDEAIKYYQMAIEKGNSDAMYSLGYLYRNEPEKKNLDEAIKWQSKKEILMQ